MEDVGILAKMYGIKLEEKKAWPKLQKCSEENDENEKWIFESIIDEGVYKCANYSTLLTSSIKRE